MAVRVVVAEDDYLVREGIKRLLASRPALDVVADCKDLDELIDAVDRENPDVVVTDICMPPTRTDEGIAAAAIIQGKYASIGVVLLTQYAEPDYAIEFFKGGTDGRAYLLKERVSEPAQIERAILAVHLGDSMIDPPIVAALVVPRTKRIGAMGATLTQREGEVLAQMAAGLTNPAIATELCISVRAVEKHINSVFSKLGVKHEPDVDGRVKAVLMYLAANGRLTPS